MNNVEGKLTTDHAASCNGIPVLVREDGAYGIGDNLPPSGEWAKLGGITDGSAISAVCESMIARRAGKTGPVDLGPYTDDQIRNFGWIGL